jgi:thiamine-monophosphate kinase
VVATGSGRERALIAELGQVLGAPLDGGGDCAVLRLPQTVLSVDQYVEGVDFDFSLMSWRDAGFRCLSAALSDLAAAGADAQAYLLALGLRPDVQPGQALQLAEGLAEAAAAAGARFAGGDLGSAAAVTLSLTAVGSVPPGEQALGRGGGQVGDVLVVTGAPGLAALGLRGLRHGQAPAAALAAFLRPAPRLGAGAALRKLKASAAVDITDGLAHELHALARASGTGAELRLASLPPLPGVSREEGWHLALAGGDDYELLAALAPDRLDSLAALVRPLPVTAVGRLLPPREGVRLVYPDGSVAPLAEGGYEHGAGTLEP